ncbi:hypothetical protein J437_LFUL015223 [Ladona fulva]|uniref:Uncharacterized protein n=1 Tax=Ladona fulva TaxID=123851 RepID=A0A8K0KHV4_LADFU|nr:hypothetical protein J437_LFUL015223 [Ladona fulva]
MKSGFLTSSLFSWQPWRCAAKCTFLGEKRKCHRTAVGGKHLSVRRQALSIENGDLVANPSKVPTRLGHVERRRANRRQRGCRRGKPGTAAFSAATGVLHGPGSAPRSARDRGRIRGVLSGQDPVVSGNAAVPAQGGPRRLAQQDIG